jgi:Leucine-rich repeat (LRR) protein
MHHTFIAIAALSILSAASLPDAGVAQWVREQGGQAETDAAGQISTVKLDLAWVADSDVERLARLSHLRKLDLSFSLITDAGIEHLKPLSGVRDLNLYSVERITDVAIAYLRGWKDLERLNLRGTDVTDTTLQYLSAFPALKALDVSHTQVTNNGMEFLPALRTLEELRLGGNKITGAGLRWLRVLPNLRLLDLEGTQKRNSGLWSVSLTDLDVEMLSGFQQLEELNLAGAKIADPAIGPISRLTHLRALNLSRTQVSGKGIGDLSRVAGLQRLSLWQAAGIGDDAGAGLASIPNLAVLDLTETKISDATLRALGAARKLRHLYLAGTAVTDAGVDAFRRAHPECEVSWK